jgi:hypothetical protein
MLSVKHGRPYMVRYKAIFARIEGLDESDFETTHGLQATRLDDACDEALTLHRPDGANFIKILDEGLVVKRLGLEL